MNYAGKFDAALSLDGLGFRAPADGHADSFVAKPFIAKGHGHVPDGAFVVPDANLIFNGEFKRAGVDLVLSHDGHDFVVHDYFRGDKRAAIASPDGAHLTGDVVNALTGHVQYAQAAGGIAAAQVIGHVTKLSGSATAVRNGVSVILNNGDNVEKGDVVSTGGDSTLGITFIDGTVFGLSSNARMVLNEMVYDPNGSNNSSLLSLVAGTITFVAGETAKHGDMKVDTPVATMGIRGTAVLSQINFVIPAGGGDPQPQASFQVLVEPNGTTGSYILFDKITLLPIATVNQAGQMIQISGGNVSITNGLLSPDVQKLITDVFTLKFTDNNTNTKLTTNFTDTITQDGYNVLIKTAGGATAQATFTNTVNFNGGGPTQGPTDHTTAGTRIAVVNSLFLQSLDLGNNVKVAFNLTEVAGQTGVTTADLVIGHARFIDLNLGDRPTVSVVLTDGSYAYLDAGQHDVTAGLSALQKQDILATEVKITVTPDPGNDSNGTTTWTFSVPDNAFDFLAEGEQLTLKYTIVLTNNFAPDLGIVTKDITIIITGTNDQPVITSGVPTITFAGGTSTEGGPLTTDAPTSGKLTFTDVDLTDTHTVSKAFTAVLPGGTVPKAIHDFLENAMSFSIAAGDDSTGTGTGTIDWSLAPIPVYLADFIPEGEVLTLTYTVTITDSQGATSQQTITVEITGTDSPAVVWIATTQTGSPSGGLWSHGANWETGDTPTIDDDVIVITNQLMGLNPSYPVTIDGPAYAKSLSMNDFDTDRSPEHIAPRVNNQSSLTIAGTLKLEADSVFANFATGTVSVGGAAEILDTGVLNNAGYLTLAGGGDFAVGTTITNSGTIELSGGTLTTLAEIDNVGGTLKVDAGATLVVNAATVEGGTVTILGTLELDGISLIENGTLNNSGKVNVNGTAEFAHETVSNTSGGTIRVLANGWLTIDQNSGVTNTGNVTVDASGKLTVNGATISGAGTITDNGEIDLTGNAVLSGGFLNNNATFKVSSTGNALNGETITNAGTIEVLANGALAIKQGSTVGNSSGNVIVDANAALTLDLATISGGAIKGAGAINVTGASKIDGGATLSVATVTAGAKLTLDGMTVSGSVITDNSSVEIDNLVKLKDGAKIQGGPVTNNGTLEIAGAATLLNDVVTNNGTVTVDDSQTLTLSGTEITGGTINNYSGLLGGTIDVTGNSTIDGNATLNKGAVTVESGVTLTLDDVTVSSAAIANHGAVKVDASKKLTLSGASLTGGTLTVSGTLDSSGATTITDASITNNGLIEAIGGLLTLTTLTSATIANAGTLQAKGAELDIDHEAVTNTGTLAAINGGTLKLISNTVTNTGATVSVASGSTLDLIGATIDGGTLTIAGTLESTGTSAINNADITNTGTIKVTSGTLTIDPAVIHTITNHALIQVSGAELDISGDLIVNTADIKAINQGILKLADVTITNGGGTVTVDATSKLYLSGVTSINGGYLTNAGNLYGVSGLNTISAAVTNTGSIEVQAGTLNLSGGLSGVGSLIIDNGATLELAGATAQTITFAGGTDTLQLDKVAGQSFTGTIAGQSTKAGTFTITGAADITTSSGDALDFTASGGSPAARGDIILTPTGALTGAAHGVVVTQNGTGNISLTATGNITGLAGNGIWLRDSATGAGDITVNNVTGKATGTGVNSVGVLVENANAANGGDISITQLGGAAGGAYGIDVVTAGKGDIAVDAGGNITGSSIYGIRSRSYGSGSTTIKTEVGSVVTSGSSGVVAVNRAESLLASDHSSITITNYGTVNSGASLNLSASAPAGLEAGYTGSVNSAGANANVYGSVVVNNYGNVTAAGGYGIHAYNYGNGDVTVNDGDGTTVIGADTGIFVQALSGGSGDVAVTLGANATVKGTANYGILAYSADKGDVSVTLKTGDKITSGSSGIVAINYAAAIASAVGSTISVEAHGTIHSGLALNTDGTTPGAIIAGYKPGGISTFSNAVYGNVTVTSDAIITADAGYGIEAYTYGIGDVTVTTGALSQITAAGTAIGAFDHGGGDVSVTNEGSATGAVGLSALAAGAGDITIVNHGNITGTSLVGISVTQNDADAAGDPVATGSTHITNSGSIVGAAGYAAIYIQANATGGALIDNSGTIGPAVASTVTSTTYAIVETGGAITINNTGDINGNISVVSATFNNKVGGIWTVAGSSVFGNVSSIVNAGEIDLLNGASVSVNGTGITNTGDIDSWGTASITGTIANNHLIEVHTGTLTLFGSLSGSGSVTIDANATLKLEGAVSQTVTFGGTGATLEIDTTSFGGSVAGLAATDKLDLSTIVYDAGTSATYDPVTGNLVVSDAYGHTITVKLVGADYSDAHFAGSLASDGHGGTLITYNAVDDKPTFTAAETSQSAVVAEQAGLTGSSTQDKSTPTSGTIHFTDIDLTDRPTATITDQTVTLQDANHHALTLTQAQANALESALSVLTTGKNNGAVTWSYSITDSALDFLGAGQTATVVSTITLDDHHGGTDTAQVTVTVTGANDAPVFDIDQISVTQTNDEQVVVHGLSVTDVDAAAGETYTLAAHTAVSGSHATPGSGSGSLSSVNSSLQTVTYHEGTAEPATDMITLSVTDGYGASDTINLIFNLAESAADHVSLAGTTGKDVYFGTAYQEQFVFAANSNHDTIVNFTSGQDHIDLSAVVTANNVATWMASHVAASSTNPADTLITIDSADTILLKGVTASSLHASDFIITHT